MQKTLEDAGRFRRTVATAALVLAPVLMVVAMGTDVPFSGEPDEVLAEMDAAGSRAWLSAMTYTLAQLALIPGMLGIAHLLRSGAPALSGLGGSLAVLGAFGHAVHAGGVFVLVSMAQSPGDRGAFASAMQDYLGSPAGLFSAMGLIGTVLGLLLLAVGLWRTRTSPRWVPAALVAFVVVEFAGSAVTPWATVIGGILYLAALWVLAAIIWRAGDSRRTVAVS